MKSTCYKLISLLLITFVYAPFGSSQDDLTFDIDYKVNRTYPSLSITKEKLNEARTLIDINPYYKPTWVKEYISVEILASQQGEMQSIVSQNDTLGQTQKDLMRKVDKGTDILVKVKYMPENNLKHNDSREMNFTFTIEPESAAAYPGGTQQLNRYLKENIKDKISAEAFEIYRLTAVEFAIDEEGQIVDAQIFESPFQTFEHTKTEELMLEAICNMPNWTPAAYDNGMKTKQEFVLTAGDHRSCVVNLLNIRRDDNPPVSE